MEKRPLPNLRTTDFGATATADIITVDDGHGGTDRLVSIEKIIGTDFNDHAIVTSGMKLDAGLTIDFGGGANTLEYNGTGASQINGPLQYLYHTQLDNGTPTGRNAKQTIDVTGTGVDKVLLANSALFVDGHQLGGGAYAIGISA